MLRRMVTGACAPAAMLAAALALLGGTPLRADAVLDWNDHLLNAVRFDKTSPPRASRIMALTHVAVYDAVNGVDRRFTPYHVTASAPAGAAAEAAAVAAAHRVLREVYPAQAPALDAARDASLAALPATGRQAGVAWGEEVAGQILALRADDGAAAVVDYAAPAGGGWWSPTPPAFAAALLPQWPGVTPWTMSDGSQFRQGPPPAPNSADYARAFNEVRRLGRKASPLRSAEQTEIALFWADGAGTASPPGHWLEIAAGIARERGLALADNARLFALLSLAVADAAVVSWDHKYAYQHWRPYSGIRGAGLDGNPDTAEDPSWEPLLATPPFPAYTSGHSTFSGAAARVLTLFFGRDDIAFRTGSDGLPGVERAFASLAAAAEEAGQSRIYGGIHWQYDNQAGLASGRALAEHVYHGFLTPLAAAGGCAPAATAACLAGGYRVEARYATARGETGAAHAVADTADSARFWFFAPDNTELVVKLVDGCALNGNAWVFASGLTDVEVLLTVTDTAIGRVRTYFSPQGRAFAPVQDTSAFACD